MDPEHLSPPYEGEGELHNRVLDLLPPSHDLVQAVNIPQLLHTPLTRTMSNMIRRNNFHTIVMLLDGNEK